MEENQSQPATPSPPPPSALPERAPGKPAPGKPAPGSAGAGRAPGIQARPAPLLRVGSPDSMLAVIPGLLGFHPARSLVVVGAGPPRGRIQVAFRYDLPEPPDAGAAAKIAAHATAILARHQLTLAIVVGYGPGPMVTPVADALIGELRRADITLHDMLRVDSGRYWSYACQDPRCCPAEGVPFDVTGHPAAAAMSAAGNNALRDRAALAASIAPLGGLAEESMRQATRRAERQAADLIRDGAASGRRSGIVQRVIGEGLRAVSEAIGICRRGGRLTGDDRIGWLAVALTDLRVRDDAWARMVPEYVEAHLRLWTDVVRRVPARYAPAPASLLAFTAWQAGNGALANVAAQRALAADPEYSMALLLLDAIGAGVPPSAARLPMTPEEVAASYARTDTVETREVPGTLAGHDGPGTPRHRPAAGRSGPAAEPRDASGRSPASSGRSPASSGGTRGPSGDTRGPSGDTRGPSGGTRGPSSGDMRGPSGDTRGPSGRSRGPAAGGRGSSVRPARGPARNRLSR